MNSAKQPPDPIKFMFADALYFFTKAELLTQLQLNPPGSNSQLPKEITVSYAIKIQKGSSRR